MIYYYHEKERITKLFKEKKPLKVPITIFFRDRSKVNINPGQFEIVKKFANNDTKSIKNLLKDTKTINNLLNVVSEKYKKINNNRNKSRSQNEQI
jgi:hypothetical protein